ncbi:MAG: hypothetical protein SFY81_01270 [Verrucomicrobiota bacterium]|nr:hypothetical protein [Verrucomicrobiota bacterium]
MSDVDLTRGDIPDGASNKPFIYDQFLARLAAIGVATNRLMAKNDCKISEKSQTRHFKDSRSTFKTRSISWWSHSLATNVLELEFEPKSGRLLSIHFLSSGLFSRPHLYLESLPILENIDNHIWQNTRLDRGDDEVIREARNATFKPLNTHSNAVEIAGRIASWLQKLSIETSGSGTGVVPDEFSVCSFQSILGEYVAVKNSQFLLSWDYRARLLRYESFVKPMAGLKAEVSCDDLIERGRSIIKLCGLDRAKMEYHAAPRCHPPDYAATEFFLYWGRSSPYATFKFDSSGKQLLRVEFAQGAAYNL